MPRKTKTKTEPEQTTAIIPAEPTQARLSPYVEQAREAVEIFRTLVIRNQEDLDFANEMTKEIKIQWDEVKAIQKALLGPFENAIRNAKGMFKPATEALSQAEQVLKEKMAAYYLEATKTREKAMAAGKDVPPPPEAKGTTFKARTGWRVVDEDKVDRKWCSPDPKKIQDYLDNGGLEAIAGIEFFDDPQVIVRKNA